MGSKHTRSPRLSDRLGSRRWEVITGVRDHRQIAPDDGARLCRYTDAVTAESRRPARSVITADLLVMLGASRDKARNLVNVAMQRQKFGDVDDLAYGLFSHHYDRVQRRMGFR
jgi:hypothetical protein